MSEPQLHFQEFAMWQRGAEVSRELFPLPDTLEQLRLCGMLLALRRRLKSELPALCPWPFAPSSANERDVTMNSAPPVQGMISQIVETLKKAYQPAKTVLFGSYAYGQPDQDSDIDLLIIKDTPDRPIDRRVTVCRLVSDPHRLVPFEPLVLTPHEVEDRLARGDAFLTDILMKGQVLV